MVAPCMMVGARDVVLATADHDSELRLVSVSPYLLQKKLKRQ